MTDLEKHVNRPGRDKLVKKVREKINELGITYIYYQFISVTGRVVGKGIPADHWERTAEKGFQLVYGATANLFLDRHNNYIGYGPDHIQYSYYDDLKINLLLLHKLIENLFLQFSPNDLLEFLFQQLYLLQK